MSLYEDEELGAPPATVAVGWSKGVKLMQSHIQLKKAAAKTIPDIHPGSSLTTSLAKPRPVGQVLAPVIDLKSKPKAVDDPVPLSTAAVPSLPSIRTGKSVISLLWLRCFLGGTALALAPILKSGSKLGRVGQFLLSLMSNLYRKNVLSIQSNNLCHA